MKKLKSVSIPGIFHRTQPQGILNHKVENVGNTDSEPEAQSLDYCHHVLTIFGHHEAPDNVPAYPCVAMVGEMFV